MNKILVALSSLFSVITFNINTATAQLATPVCQSANNTPWNYWIGAVSVGSVTFTQTIGGNDKGANTTNNDFTTAAGANFGIDRTQPSTKITIIGWNNTAYVVEKVMYYAAYIDYNNDGNFDENTEKLTPSTTNGMKDLLLSQAGGTPALANRSYDFNVTVPSNVINGMKRLRVIMKGDLAVLNSCESNIVTGEVEDYAVNITGTSGGGTTCTTAPNITCPSSVNVTALSGANNANVSFNNATATTSCAGTPIITYAPQGSGSLFVLGTTTITATATDANVSTLKSTCSFAVTVNPASSGGGTTPTLQQVTTAGNTTSTNTVFIGKVSIGTSSPNFTLDNSFNLLVKGGIHSEKVKVDVSNNTWADFVFKPDYKLPKLETVAQFINKNGHLPNIPTEKEVQKDGIDLGSMNTKLLQKVEELTLYLIEMKKEIDKLKKELKNKKDK